MKGFILGLLFLSASSAFAVHPASEFTADTMTRAFQILEIKEDGEKVKQMCSIFKRRMALSHVSNAWLGRYASLERDQAGVREFRKMMPSLLVTQFYPALGMAEGGTFTVDPNARDKGNGRFEVPVKVRANGRNISATAIIGTYSGEYKLVDVKAFGMSAVNYIGKDYKERLDEEYRLDPQSSLPVSAVVEQVKGSENYIACP